MGLRERYGSTSRYAAPLELGYSPAIRATPLNASVPILSGDAAGPVSRFARSLAWRAEALTLARLDAHAMSDEQAERTALARLLARRDTASSALALKVRRLHGAIGLYVASFQPDAIDLAARRQDIETLAGAHMDLASAQLLRLADAGRPSRTEPRAARARRQVLRDLHAALIDQLDSLLSSIEESRRLHLLFREEFAMAADHCASAAQIAQAKQLHLDYSARISLKAYLDERRRRERRDGAAFGGAAIRPVRPPSADSAARRVQQARTRIDANLRALDALRQWVRARRAMLDAFTPPPAGGADAAACARIVSAWRGEFARRPEAAHRPLAALYRR